MDKTEIIHQLAGEFGMAGQPKRDDSHYDRNTGTLFVGSKVYHYEDMERAKRFFKENAKKTRHLGDAACDLYEIGEMAVEKLMDESHSAGGRVVIKEGEGA